MPKRCEVQLYLEDGWTPSKIIGVLAAHRSVKEYAFILHDKDVDEDGNPIKPHYHLWLDFGKNNVKLVHTAKWFGIKVSLVSYIKTNKYNTILYFLHVNQFGKYRYRLEDVEANFDVKKYLDSAANEKNLYKILSMCSTGAITRWNYTEQIDEITYAKHRSMIENAFAYGEWKKLADNQGKRHMLVFWLYGKTGSGKTTLATMFAEQKNLPIYITASGQDPFSHYANQPVVLLDDLRTETMGYVELLKLTDPYYSSPVKSRYHNKDLGYCEYLFITTVYAPEEFCRKLHLNSIDSDKQLYRRLTEVWKVDEHTVEISEYLEDCNTFELVHRIDNPASKLVAKSVTKKVEQTGFDVLSEINRRYTGVDSQHEVKSIEGSEMSESLTQMHMFDDLTGNNSPWTVTE